MADQGCTALIPHSTKDTYRKVMYKIYSRVVGQVEQQNSAGAQPELETSGTDDSTPTCNMTIFYPGEVPFRNQGTSTSPLHNDSSKDGKGIQSSVP